MTDDTETRELPQWKVITETPEDLLKVPCVLGGKIGETIYEDIERQYGESAVEGITSNSGSNPFYVSAVNDRLLEMTGGKARVATHADLERLRKLGEEVTGIKLGGCYWDSGLVLLSADVPNKTLADRLDSEARNLGLNCEDAPVVFWLRDFAQPTYEAFELREGAQPFQAEILEGPSENYLTEDIDKKTGLPTKLSSEGDRHLYTPVSKSGVRRLYLDVDRIVGAVVEHLRDSGSNGRVAIVDAEGKAISRLEAAE